MEKEKKLVRKGQRLLAKLGAACISEKGNGRLHGLAFNVGNPMINLPFGDGFYQPFMVSHLW